MTAAAKTPSQRGRANRNKGNQAERDLCRWLRINGLPHAERAVRTGFRTLDRTSADPGDITGTPLILWSVKDCAVEQIGKWFDELDDMSDHAQTSGCLTLLVLKRRGHADPARWWCWQWQSQYLELYRTWLEGVVIDRRRIPELPLWIPPGTEYPMRMELGHVIPLLRAAGYGSPLEAAS